MATEPLLAQESSQEDDSEAEDMSLCYGQRMQVFYRVSKNSLNIMSATAAIRCSAMHRPLASVSKDEKNIFIFNCTGAVTVCWRDLNVWARARRPNRFLGLGSSANKAVEIDEQGRGKQILHGVSGCALPGQLIALMGARCL